MRRINGIRRLVRRRLRPPPPRPSQISSPARQSSHAEGVAPSQRVVRTTIGGASPPAGPEAAALRSGARVLACQ